MKTYRTFLLFSLLQIFFSLPIFAQEEPEAPKIYKVNMQRRSMWGRVGSETQINVCWENPQGFSAETAWVREAISQTWESSANIKFLGWNQCSSTSKGIRILIKDGHPHTKGLGTDIDGMRNGMELNFTFNNFACYQGREQCVKFIAVHEFGHALGLAHEQDRSDCLCGEETVGGGGWYVTECDLNSVMNYCNPRWNNYGKLSELDKKGIQAVYGKKLTSGTTTTTTTTTGGGGGNRPTVVTPPPSRKGSFTVVDELGDGQYWENVYMNFGGVDQVFSISQTSPKDAKTLNIEKSGSYVYKLWSSTAYTNGQTVEGYGEGRVYLEAGKQYNYSIAIKTTRQNSKYYYVLELKTN